MNQLFKAASEAVSTSKQAARQAKEASDVVLMQAIKVLLASGVSIRETASMLDSSKATVGRLAALPSTAAPIPSTDGESTDLVVSNGWGSQKRLDEVYEWCLIYDGEHEIELPPAVLDLTKAQALKNLRDAYEQERIAGESRLTDDERNAVRRRCRLAVVIARARGVSGEDLTRAQN
jgi:Trp operon repressor